jgi:LuxR family maltose regulon positive regulatory protein
MARNAPQLAKLTRPRLHRAVPRARLLSLLDEARAHKPAIAVIGPPGAGKTTLVASWLDARGIEGIWYQVDSGDADLATFFYYLGEAARPFSRKGQRSLPPLTPEYLHDVEGFSRRFFRELFARVPQGAALVLDNCEEVPTERPLHRLISQAVSEIPARITMIVVSRHSLPDCYARSIANGIITCLEWPLLKLTLPEAQAIAAQKGRTALEQVRSIHTRADGWAAGIALMLERTLAVDTPSDIAPDTHRATFDYFASEIFGRIEEEARRLLMATAWLPTVGPTVAAALTGCVHAEAILEDLYRRHLFVHRRTGESPSYQYHALFRHFLREQARREFGARALDQLKAKAARLLEQSGAIEPAIELHCDAKAWGEAVRLMVACAPRLLAHGRGGTLEQWAARLPADLFGRTPWLRYWLGVSKFADAPSDAREHLRQALRMFESQSDVIGRILCLTGILESHWTEFSGHDEIEMCLNSVLPLLDDAPRFPDAETELRVLCVLYAAMLLRQPRNPRIVPTRNRILSFVSAEVSDDAKLLAGGALLADSLQTGDLALGDRAIATLGELAEHADVSSVARLMWALRLPMYFAHKGDYREAEAAWERAHALLTEEGVLIGRGFLYYTGAFDSILAGDLVSAGSHVARLEETHAALDRPLYRDLAHWLRCMIALARGDARRAAGLGRKAVAGARARKVAWPIVWFGVATVYALLEAGEYLEAETEIETLREFIRGTFMEHFEVELLLAQAYLALELKNWEPGRALLLQAWALAREHDFVFGYRSAFRAHRRLYSETLRQGIDPDYVRSVIRRFKLRPEDASDDRWPWPIKVQTLGRFVVLLDDKPLAFGRKVPRKPISLLKAIVALGEHGVSEQQLIDALWPDEEGDAAHHALALTLHRLRRLLGHQDAITVADGVLGLNDALVWTDVRAFEALFERGDPGAEAWAVALLRWYRGSFLADDGDEPWAVSTRERLRSRFLNAVDRAGTALESAGRFDEATALYLRGLDADPLAEMFYRGLIRCHVGQGRHAEAISTYRRLRQTLSVVLGIQPSPSTEALVRGLRTY